LTALARDSIAHHFTRPNENAIKRRALNIARVNATPILEFKIFFEPYWEFQWTCLRSKVHRCY